MKFLIVNLYLILSISIFSQELTQEFFHEESVPQGSPITFVISPYEGHIEYTFSLINKKGRKVLQVPGFYYYFYEERISVILGLGGIPVDLPPGIYTVKAEGIGVIHSYFFERSIEVTPRDFKQVTLKANIKMDSIVNGEKDPDQDAQYRRLWDAISIFSPHILYEQSTLSQPVEGRHSSPFGFTRVTEFPSGKNSTSYHKGEDFATKIGTPVLSDGKGRVILAENRIITGNTVVVEHLPGVKTIYYHMDSIDVKKGNIVNRGDKIGEVGTTGYSTGPHLHWEVRINTVPVDPMLFLERPILDKTLILGMIGSTNKKRGG